jgi:membrane protein
MHFQLRFDRGRAWHAGCAPCDTVPGAKEVARIGRELLVQAKKDDVAGLSTELAYRTFLELFPFFIFLSMVGGAAEQSLHVPNPARQMLDLLNGSLPQGAADPIRQQLETVLGSQHGLIGLPIVGVLWLAAGSGASLLKALNRIYEIEETRPFWERYLVGLWLTLLAGAVLAVVLLLLSAGDVLSQKAGGDSAPGWFQTVAGFARWPLLAFVLAAEAAVVFRVAPNAKPPWSLITPGALVFVGGWMVASALFVIYVDKSGGYASTYGVLGGVVVLMLWLQITAYALLLGAELNDVLEHPSSVPSRAWERGRHRDRDKVAA